MSEQPPNSDSGDEHGGIADPSPGGRGTQSAGEPASGVPRWVKVFAIVGGVLVVLVVVMLLAGHGPSRHGGLATVALASGTATPTAVAVGGHG